MRKPRLAALAGLLALAAAVPATADPVRLDEAGLGGVAAGAEAAVPGLSVSDLTSVTSTTNTSASSTVADTVAQTLGSTSENVNYATGVNAAGVLANGSALSTVAGSVR
jgi:uncharacterized membrane protein YqiK